jgi:hypothetical protein
VFDFVADEGNTIDLGHLGLPPLEESVIGVVLSRGPSGEMSIRALAVDRRMDVLNRRPLPPSRVTTHLLEHPAAALDTSHEVQDHAKGLWVQPGNRRLARSGKGIQDRVTVSGDWKTAEIQLSSEKSAEPASAEETWTHTLIRAKPTRAEKQKSRALSPEDHWQREQKHRIRRKLAVGSAAALAALSVAVSAPDMGEKPSDREVSSAQDLVGDPHVSVLDGKPQAERFFDSATLTRSRVAVEAYLAGDMASLKKQQETAGYETDWVSAETMSLLQNAESFAELEGAFNSVFKSGNISLHVIGGQKPGLPTNILKRDSLNLDDLGTTKKGAIAILQMLQMFPQDELSTSNVRFFLSKNLRDADLNLAGHARSGNVSGVKRADIELDINVPMQVQTAAHEWEHWRDFVAGDGHSSDILNLNPSGVTVYSAGGENTGTTAGGYEVTVDSYSRTSSKEDVASIAGYWQSEPGEVELDRSPRGEKLMDYLFTLESQYPGATAAFLRHAQPKLYEGTRDDWMNYIVGVPGKNLPHQPVYVSLAISLLVLLAEQLQLRRARRPISNTK